MLYFIFNVCYIYNIMRYESYSLKYWKSLQFFFSKRTSNEYNDGYKRPQTPHDVIYVNSILMLIKKSKKKKRLKINLLWI